MWVCVIFAAVVSAVAINVLWAWNRREKGMECWKCAHCHVDVCMVGLGWEPLPPLRTCGRWRSR
jgi:hypothetical protein